ncbi:SDR family NAD(P)-dependent oxidoreductase [Burkholderia diffusa]|uniref:SDR family NAD(P)-dependent oxidoreductase n=1 Tax=Burkholderia diffusa TaxID=488732 RepID=UPI001589F6A1|nr:SDR family oxidoreductase [Burkholderia diffusa]
MKTLKDKTAVITGAGSGIGRAIALALADAGTHIVVADIHADTAQAVADEVRSRGVRSLAVTCDVSDHASVVNLAEQAYAEFGTVDILCNNAGISWRPYRSIVDATLDDWRFILGINLWGVLNGLDAFLPRMRQQAGEKHIVNTASLASLFPHEGHAPYSASKAAVASLSEVIARELKPYGFGVTIVCPGAVTTNLGENTTRIRGDAAPQEPRVFEPVDTPTIRRMHEFALPSAEPLGVMVRNAILDDTMYLHTNALPFDLVAERVNTWFGPQTVGKA